MAETPESNQIVLRVEYDGTAYAGFQTQRGARPTVQDQLEAAVYQISGARVKVRGASRTDAGAHALGQVVAFPAVTAISGSSLMRALNRYLPDDIAVQAAGHAPARFDVRRHAVRRHYQYRVLNRGVRSPILGRTTHWVARRLDVAAMDAAAGQLIGCHDFAAFTGPSGGKRTVRTIYEAGVRSAGDLVYFDVVGNAFLPRQIRTTAGALVAVGLHRMTQEAFRVLIDAGDPAPDRLALPAKGLFLVSIDYGDQTKLMWEAEP